MNTDLNNQAQDQPVKTDKDTEIKKVILNALKHNPTLRVIFVCGEENTDKNKDDVKKAIDVFKKTLPTIDVINENKKPRA